MNQEKALNLLKQFSCIETKKINSQAQKEELAQALILISNLSESQNLGICADHAILGFKALKSYLHALGYESDSYPEAQILGDQPIYLKFSTERMSYSTSNYGGEYRGVLVTIFSDYNEDIIGTYGHLPLDLFD